MDYIFNRLTDIGLRRIYKFILKRTIGKYLQNELLIEQLEVQSRDGIVRLYDLELNADLLNEEVFNKTPVRAKVLKVNQIEVFLSYTSMLTESCTFTIDTLDIILEPNDTWQPDSSSPVKTTSSSNEANANTRSPERTEEDLSEEGHQGLSFIANWIEVIIAKLKASVNHVNIYLETKSGPSLQLSLHHISYLNNDPQVFGAGQSTMELSTRMMSGVDPTASLLLGSTKIVKVATIDVIIHHEEKDIMLLQVTNSSQVRVKLDAGMSVTSVHGIDVDVMIPFFSINLEKESCLALASIIEEYSTTPRAQSPSRPTHLDTSSFVQDILERHNNPSAFLNKYEQELRSNLDKNSASNRSTLGDELNIEDGDLLKILSIMKQVC